MTIKNTFKIGLFAISLGFVYNAASAQSNVTCKALIKCAESQYNKAILEVDTDKIRELNQTWAPIFNCCKAHNNDAKACQKTPNWDEVVKQCAG